VAHIDLVQAWVEKLLREAFTLDELIRDDDGDYPFRYGSAAYFVRVLDRDPPLVRVFAIAVTGVSGSASLYEELNDLNASLSVVRVSHAVESVFVEVDLFGDALEREQLLYACLTVGQVADHVGPLLAATFGGTTAFPVDDDDPDLLDVDMEVDADDDDGPAR
jgi:hypothetical protein